MRNELEALKVELPVLNTDAQTQLKGGTIKNGVVIDDLAGL